MIADQPTYLELFCGAGGLSLGLKWAGWRRLAAFDVWTDAVESFNRNLGEPGARLSDIRELDADVLRDFVASPPDWVVGGPPCQGFSTVGRREKEDPRNRLVREFARVVNLVRPRGFVIENVLGLRDMNFAEAVVRHFEELGFRTTFSVVSAADFGVPQLRRRVVFVGMRGDSYLDVERAFRPRVTRHTSVWEAIGDLPALGAGESASHYAVDPFTEFQRVMRGESTVLDGHVVSRHPLSLVRAISHIPDGGNRFAIPTELQPRSGFHNSYSRLHSGSPAVAITQNLGKPSGTRCIHPFQDRGLSTREGARLQSFPDWFRFVGGITSQRLQIANAVPPLLGKAIGVAVATPANWTLLQNPIELSHVKNRSRKAS